MAQSIPLMENQEEIPSQNSEKQAENLQQYYYECFGNRDWDVYNHDEHVFLKRNIGFAIFGKPGDILDTTTGYTKSRNKQICEIYAAIMKNHYLVNTNIILVRTIFNCCIRKNKKRTLFVEPIFVLKKCHNEDGDMNVKNCTLFIDSSARVYKNWQLYLENNKLPKCWMVIPKNGQYSGEILNDNTEEVKVILEKHESPACSIGNAILQGTDIVGTLASIGTTAVFAVAAIPAVAVAPVVLIGAAATGAAVSAYSVGRSTHTLVDRSKHGQSIALDNAESRWCYLNTSVVILGASTSAATGLLTRAASRGVEIGQTARIAYNTLNGANVIGSAANMGLSTYHIIDKVINDERPSLLEIFQLASSVLFFHLSIVNLRTASAVISETQSATILRYEEGLRSENDRILFRKALLEAHRLTGEAKGNAEIIKGIRNINDPDNFFAALANINKDLNKNNARYTITTDGKVQINTNYIIDPIEFAQISSEARGNILETLPAFKQTPSAMPKPKFELFNNIITKCCEELIKNPGLLIIIRNILTNEVDIQTMSILLQNYTYQVIKYFLNILISFLREINDTLNDYTRIYPIVSVPVGALQFLINHVEMMAKDLEIELSSFIQTFFNVDGSVNKESLKTLKEKFQAWITEKMNSIMGATDAATIDIRNKTKIKKVCKICCGFFYETK